jgi:LacI family transcriptional regulator
MRDVARLAGNVHPSTVSLVLRNSPNISPATAKKVLDVARKIGYRRDPLLDAYNQHRMGVLPHKTEPVIAWIADLDSKDGLENQEPQRSFWHGARAAAEHLHCKLEPFLVGRNQLSPERVNGILRARGITALIVAALRLQTGRLAFSWEDFSAVKIESPHLAQPMYTISCDQRRAARLAFLRLYERGARRIGLVLQPGCGLWDGRLAASGFLFEQQSHPEAAQIAPLLLSETAEAGAVLRTWLGRHRLDALISDSLQLRTLVAGLPSPSALPEFVALDATGGPPDQEGVLPDHQRAGAQAVELVVSLMRANQRGTPAAASTTFLQPSYRDKQ